MQQFVHLKVMYLNELS